MPNRREFIQFSFLGLPLLASEPRPYQPTSEAYSKPLVVSTWDSGIRANAAAWKVLARNGSALDAVEQAARSAEDEVSCCVGLNANPDRDGKVTLDVSIMDERSNCGGVAFVQRIKHPISVARRLMETSPHVLLVGDGAEQFAVENGFTREREKLSDTARQAWREWLKTSRYQPGVNIENQKPPRNTPVTPKRLSDGKPNHDTMGTIALDRDGHLSGACTTSGMAFKVHGRVGDSPVIGAGLFVDNEVGAATSSGVGEEVIRICGSHVIIELMRMGQSPERACEEAIRRIVKRDPEKAKSFQVGFIAIGKSGEIGAFSIQKEFTYSVTNASTNRVFESKSVF